VSHLLCTSCDRAFASPSRQRGNDPSLIFFRCVTRAAEAAFHFRRRCVPPRHGPRPRAGPRRAAARAVVTGSRAFQRAENLLLDDRGDLGAPAAQPGILLDGEQAPVRADSASIVSYRAVTSDRTSITVALMPSTARASAASPPPDHCRSAMIVASAPRAALSRRRAARRARRRELRPCSQAGSCARRTAPDPDRGIAAASSPFASAGLDGAIT